MSQIRSMFAPPRGGDPRETLEWVRRLEIISGLLGLIGAAVSWSGEWWSWLIVATSLLSLSPRPGAAAILRRSETRPEVLITDPRRRRERGRRFLRYLVPINLVIYVVIGYLLAGLTGATLFLVLGGAGLGLGVWMYRRVES